jgi:hypothetical protein
LFLHWRCDPEILQERLPPGLTVDTFDDSAWMAIVPFEMRTIRPRSLPAVPYISNFLELNLRTYVFDENGTPGVWFFSLNANRSLAAMVGRGWFRLPYFWCRMKCVTDRAGWIDYRCRRFSDPQKRTCRFKYRPTGDPEGAPAQAADGTLEFFLVERYILFAALPDGRRATGQVHHAPYPVQPADVEIWDEGQFAIDGFPAPGRPPDHVLFSPGVDVEVFGLKPIP